MSSVFTHQGGKVLHHNETLGAVDIRVWTVPLGKKWKFISCYAERDVNSALNFSYRDENNDRVWRITEVVAGLTDLYIPNDLVVANETAFLLQRPILAGGWDVVLSWAVAQTAPEVNLHVLEV